MDLNLLISAFSTLFVTVDPVGLAPIFIALTQDLTSAERRKVAWLSCLIGFCVLALAAIGGKALLAALGISLDAFRIAGGLFLFYTGFEMLFEMRQPRRQSHAKTAVGIDHIKNIAAFPLAIPLMAGPGAITATILLASKTQGHWMNFLGVLATIFAVVLLTYVTFILAGFINRALGQMGRIVVTRLLGLLLGALAVQFIADGVKSLAAGG
ncbi:MAG: MarC family protein [Alphaproteobacteria bacterium]